MMDIGTFIIFFSILISAIMGTDVFTRPQS